MIPDVTAKFLRGKIYNRFQDHEIYTECTSNKSFDNGSQKNVLILTGVAVL